MAIVPVGVDIELFRPLPEVDVVPGRLVTTASADVTMKGLQVPAGGRGQAAHRARRRPPRRHRQAQAGRGQRRRPSSALGLEDHVEFVTDVPERRIIELYSEAEMAVVPSLYEGFSLPAIEAMACGTPLVATTGGALPEVVGKDGDTALVVPPGDSEALAARIRWGLEQTDLRATIGRRRPPAHHRPLVVDAHRRQDGRAVPHPPRGRGPVAGADRPLRRARACAPGDLLLDLGCGAGRHAFEAFRRGARVVAFDYSAAELKDVAGLFAAMRDGGEAGTEPGSLAATHERRRRCACPSPTTPSTAIIAVRGARARRRRPGAPSTSWPGCCKPGRHDRRHRARVAARAGLLGAVRRVPRARSSRAATCASTPRPSCGPRMRRRRARAPAPPTTPTPCTRRTGGCKCAVGPTNDDHPLVRAYHQVLVWDIARTQPMARHPAGRAAPQPRPRQEPGRVRPQARRGQALTPMPIDVPGLVTADRPRTPPSTASPSGSCRRA